MKESEAYSSALSAYRASLSASWFAFHFSILPLASAARS